MNIICAVSLKIQTQHQTLKNMKKTIFLIITEIAFLAIIAFIVFHELSSGNVRISDSSFDDVWGSVLTASGTAHMVEGDNQMIRRLYGLDPEIYDGAALYYPETNMASNELFLLKVKDISQIDGVLERVEIRRNTQLKNFEGYGAEQTDMLEQSIIVSDGGYILFISGDDPQLVNEAFNNAL